MKSRDIAIVGILLAIGAILRYLSNIIPGAIVANPVIALYCLAIILIAPKIRDALGIGIVAGIMSALISHSIFPPANLISEPIGALVCLLVYTTIKKKLTLAPGIATFIATLASGFSFLAICIVVLLSSIISAPGESFTITAFIFAVSPIVVLTAVANGVITQILYLPSARILMMGQSGHEEKNAGKEEFSNTQNGTVISFNNFSYTYPQGNSKSLTDITTEIKKGEFVLVNGPTGAGKTTFCLATSGILHHEYEGKTTGSITLLGQDVCKYHDMGDIGRHVGVVFDDADAQLIFTTVEEEILSGLENRGFERKEVKKRLNEVMDLTDTEIIRYRAPHTLSGGQKQRVAIAATIAAGTDCLILDEATAELDTDATAMIIRILKRLKDEGKTIIVVEQKFDELIHLADSVITLENGRLLSKVSATGIWLPEEKEVKKEDPASAIILQSAKTEEPVPEKPIITIENLVHEYNGEAALSDINLVINRGELVAIIGENGSGKTTLARHLNGLLLPTRGKVTVAGLDTSQVSVTELAKVAGLIFQNPDTMLFEDTVEKEILFGLKNIGAEETDKKIQSVLNEAGLEESRQRFPRSMSRGERQRLAIACVTVMQPDIIILDEPTTGLDEAEATRTMEIIRHLHEEGHTIIMISHDMKIVRGQAERIISMEDGRIVSDTITGNYKPACNAFAEVA